VCRYVELNLRMMHSFRQYDASLPNFLRNRPRDFVQHVCKRWLSAEAFTASHISTTGDCVFSVFSADSGNTYTVDFGLQTGMPSCECEDWARSHWLCKHFCAVFQRTSHGWESIAADYRGSPYFMLDTEVVNVELSDTQLSADIDSSTPVTEEAVEIADTAQEVCSDQQSSVNRTAIQCREALRQMTDATYICHDASALLKLWAALSQALSDIRQHVPADAGLLLSTSPVAAVKSSLDHIPVRRQRRRVRAVPAPINESTAAEVCTTERVTMDDVIVHSPPPAADEPTAYEACVAQSATSTAESQERPVRDVQSALKLRPNPKKVGI